jgi:hypothetical protein
MMSDPQSFLAALANRKRKKFVGKTRGQQERIGQAPKEAHLGKETGSHFAVAFAFAFAFILHLSLTG